MAMNTGNPGLGTPEFGPALVQELMGASVAFQVSQNVQIGSTNYHFPVITADPSAAWTAEGADIVLSDATTVEEVVTPKKVAGLTKLSRELVTDNTTAAQAVLDGIVRDIARTVDAAYFGSTTVNGPAGLESLTTANAVDPGTAWVNLDAFAEAIADARGVSAEVTAFVANPADALTLDQLKQGSGSNVPLLGADPTAPTKRSILGIPLYTSPSVTAGTIWGIPSSRVHAVIRTDAEVMLDESVYFDSDSVAVRGITRVAFAYPHPEAVQKIILSAA